MAYCNSQIKTLQYKFIDSTVSITIVIFSETEII